MIDFRWIFYVFGTVGAVFLLSNCADQSGHSGKTIKVVKTRGFNPHHGPFDSKGNYVDDWADSPPRRVFVGASEIDKHDPPEVTPPPIAYVPPAAKPKSSKNKPSSPKPKVKQTTKKKPTPKPAPTKVTPKRKPPIIHTVAKGDTLYGLARKYKSGVKTIQIANGLRGTTIQVGQKLKIPRY